LAGRHQSIYFRGMVSDQNPHKNEKLDPDPHSSQNSGAFEAKNGAVDAQNRGVMAKNGGLEGL
jgi:hypothetical protein